MTIKRLNNKYVVNGAFFQADESGSKVYIISPDMNLLLPFTDQIFFWIS